MTTFGATPKLAKQDTERNDDLQVWTAARCNRLLRQITSRVAHLRHMVNEAVDVNRTTKRAVGPNEELPEKKRVRHTYGGRRAKAMPLRERDGNISTPPRVMRALGAMRPHLPSSPAVLCCPTPAHQTLPTNRLSAFCNRGSDATDNQSQARFRHHGSASRLLKQISGDTPPDRLKIYQAILTWLKRLLQLTDERKLEPGRKSLLGMCLRKMPECIDEMDAWDRLEAETLGVSSMWKSDDAAATIYRELEAFGGSEYGWKPFKHLVKSHVIQVLSHATEEGLFTSEFVTTMASTCVDMQCNEEAERLLVALGQTSVLPGERSPSCRSSNPAQSRELCHRALVDLSVGDSYTSVILPALGSAISRQQLLIEDIPAKQRASIWKAAFAALHNISTANQGVRFLVPTLSALASGHGKEPWSSQKSREGMLMSLSAGVASAAITSPVSHDTRRHLHVLETSIAEVVSNRGRSHKAQHSGLFLLTMARQLVLETDKTILVHLRLQGVVELSSLISRSDVQCLYRQTVGLMCSIAHACSRSTGKASHENLEILRMALHDLPLPQWFVERLRSEGAFVLAQKTKDLRDLAFAENLPETRHLFSAQDTKATTSMFSGWRWEAGISEWILPSPTGKAAKEGSSVAPRHDDESIDIVPHRVKHHLRGGLLSTDSQREYRLGNHGTDRNDKSRIPQSRIRGARRNTHIIDEMPQDQELSSVSIRKGMGSLRRRSISRVRTQNKLCRVENIQTVGLCDEQPARTHASAARGGTATEKLLQSSGVKDVGTWASMRNEDRVVNGTQEIGVMRNSTVMTKNSRTHRRKSTTALPRKQTTTSASASHVKRRRTTVSLSSLAILPMSDDWDELQ